MHIVISGLNHKTALLGLREKMSFNPASLPLALKLLNKQAHINGCIILSTCNRTEIYVATGSPQDAVASIFDFLKRFKGVDYKNYQDNFYIYSGKEAMRHLFKVTSGMDSMVVGETQILGQVKDAYQAALLHKTTSKEINIIFQKAFNVAKKVRKDSKIGQRPVSISSIALGLLRKNFRRLKDKKILIIGSGKISELTVKSLLKDSVEKLYVANRTFAKAKKFAKAFNAQAIKFSDVAKYLVDVDILISCTSAPHLIIKRQDVDRAFSKRSKRLFILDLAIPRDVDPAIAEYKKIKLYNIDDLKRISDVNLKSRHKQVTICNSMVEKESFDFSRELFPVENFELMNV